MDDRKTLRVHCYAGHRGEETPRRFYLDSQPVDVVTIIDRWMAPQYRYFKCQGADDNIYILRHDVAQECWDLVMFANRTVRREWEVADPKQRH